MPDAMQGLGRAPSIVTLLTTYRCTAACAHCCFGCNPKHRGGTMSLRRMRRYVDTVLEAFPGDIKLLALSGGECSLLGWRLPLIILYARLRGLMSRIVTNGHWATSLTRATRRLRWLQRLGLTEVNFSTGDDHQAWVPLERIVHGCVAAYRLSMRCVVNVETHPQHTFTYHQFREIPAIAEILAAQQESGTELLTIVPGVWVTHEKPHTPVVKQHEDAPNTVELPPRHQGCDSLFNTLTIDPQGRIPACCGLTAKQNAFLQVADRVGSPQEMRQSWYNQYTDFLKLWLEAEGPLAVLEYIYRKKGEPVPEHWVSRHACDLCREIFRPERLAALRQVYHELEGGIFFRSLLKRRYEAHMGGACRCAIAS